MVSKKKLAANRKNAQSSTGPNDTTNTRYNALKHGISSEQAIVPTVDGNDAAKLYDERRNGLWQDLSPQGTLESALVDRIALSMQQHTRLLAYENAVIQLQAESSSQRLVDLSQADRAIIERVEALLTKLDRPEELAEAADLTYLLAFLQEGWGVSGEQNLGKPAQTKIEGDLELGIYSLEQRRSFIDFACEQSRSSEDELRAQFKEYLGQQLHRTEKELKRNNTQLDRRRGLASLPDDADLNRILKYQSRIDRGLYKNLHELQRLQAARQGEHPLVPAAVDVTVDVDALTPDDTLAAAVAAMDHEERIVVEDPDGQLGAVEVGQLSETPSGSRSTNKHSAEANESSQSSGREEESRPADAEPESQQRSVEDWRRLITPKRKGITLKDYLDDAEVARLFAQRNVVEARDGDRGEPPSAG